MKIKIIIIVTIVILIAIFIIVCRDNAEEEQFMIPMDKFDHAYRFNFSFMVYKDGEEVITGWSSIWDLIAPGWSTFNPHYDELIFVHSLEEAREGNFPDNVIVAWPYRPLFTQASLAEINNTIKNPVSPWGERLARNDINLEDFDLTYPITVDDLVDNWEGMVRLWPHFAPRGMERIRWPGRRSDFPPFDPLVTPITIDGEKYNISDEQQVIIEKFNYALAMRFWFIISVDGRRILSESEVRARIDPSNPDFDPFYTEIVFIHHEHMTREIPANVIVAFPLLGHDTRNFISRLQNAVNRRAPIVDGEPLRDIIHFRDFGLSYPLDRDDLVDNWQQVNALWNALHPSEQEAIRNIDYLLEGQN